MQKWKADEETAVIRGLRWGVVVVVGLLALGLVVTIVKRNRSNTDGEQGRAAKASQDLQATLEAPGTTVTEAPAESPIVADPFQMDWRTAERFLKSLGYPSVHPSGDTWLRADDERCDTDDECRTRKPSIIFHYKVRQARGPACVSFVQIPGFDWRPSVQLTRPVAGEIARLEKEIRATQSDRRARDFSGRIRTEAGEMEFFVRDEGSVIVLGPYCGEFI